MSDRLRAAVGGGVRLTACSDVGRVSLAMLVPLDEGKTVYVSDAGRIHSAAFRKVDGQLLVENHPLRGSGTEPGWVAQLTRILST